VPFVLPCIEYKVKHIIHDIVLLATSNLMRQLDF